jgi:hypothetical protein
MERNTKILLGVGVVGLVGYALWRNYGVKPKDVVILSSGFGNPSTDTSNEQKELIKSIQSTYKIGGRPSDGDKLDTSFGKYKFVLTKAGNGMWIANEGYWTKYAEVWQGFADDKNQSICPKGFKYVRFPIIHGFQEHTTDSRGGKCVENDVNVTIEDLLTHPAPKLNASGRGNTPCVYLSGNELINGLTSTYDSNICVSSSGRGQVYSEHNTQWKSKI